jgi:hypothetical protein
MVTDPHTPQLPEGFVFSQSSLQDYADCPRRFQLRYVERLAWPAVETEPALENERRQQDGQLFHRMVQQHRLGLPPERLAALAEVPDLQRWWGHYLGQDFGLKGSQEYVELSLSAPVAAGGRHWRLLAKYDLVAVWPGKRAVILDWKTYGRRPRDERMAARLQTRVYRALLVQAGAQLNGGTALPPEQVEMVYWYADFPSEPARFPYSEGQYKRDWDLLTKMIAEIAGRGAAQGSGEFEMTEDEQDCAYCPYRSYCERGTAAGEGREAEAELDGAEISFEQVQEVEF